MMKQPTVITRMIGGLGNQIFQYAVARKIAYDYKEELGLDTSAYDTYYRPYLLNQFNITGNYLTIDDASFFEKFRKRFSFLKFFDSFRSNKKRLYRKEKNPGKFDKKIIEKDSGTKIYLDGYWQHEEYFRDIKDILIKELTLKNNFTINNKQIYKRITETESVSIHIRRGDNFSKPNLGACSIDYFNKCVQELTKRVSNPHFFIFICEEIEWAKNNLKINYPVTYVSEIEKLTDGQELIAMSMCKHNIIANSSFSWWSAWLNQNPNKLVFAPDRWNKKGGPKKYDIIPNDWIKVKASLESA